MTFEIELNGRSRTVSIERAGDGRSPRHRRRAIARDRRRAARAASSALSLLFPDAAHEGCESSSRPGGAPGELLAYLAGRSVTGSRQRPPQRRARRDGGAGAHGEQKVVAPMPGRVVRVLVAAGDEVEAPPAGRRRRSDEDGERAALAQGRTRQGRRGDAREPRSRPARVLVVIE